MNCFQLTLLLTLTGFSYNTMAQEKKIFPENGAILRFDKALDKIIDTNTRAEIIAEGFEWSEGPLWVQQHNMLLFSDVPKNTIYKWTDEKGLETYLSPSGYTGATKSLSKEPGSNGLTLNEKGELILCQHGNRQMARMDVPLNAPQPEFTTLAATYNGKKFSSPNDCAFNNKGELFFTDPPYGLPSQNDRDPSKELPFNGVYKLKKDGTIILLTDSITRPNGIAFFPGHKKLLVANSDPAKPFWYIYDVKGDQLSNGKIFFHPKERERNWKGLPDGLKISKQGIVFATGPGGIYIFSKEGQKLGIIRLENPASNCALSTDEKTLFITNDMYLLRIKLK